MIEVAIPTGNEPGWEVGEDGTSLIAEVAADADEEDEDEAKLLKSIPEVCSMIMSSFFTADILNLQR